MSKVYFFCQNHLELIKIESNFLRGIPNLSYIGLSGKESKELLLKMKSALLSHSFEWSLKRHFVLNSDVESVKMRKSRALSFAVTIDFLIKTKQLDLGDYNQIVCLSEMSLDGRLKQVSGRGLSYYDHPKSLFVGNFDQAPGVSHYLDVAELEDLKKAKVQNSTRAISYKSEEFPEDFEYLKKEVQEVFEIISLGQHSSLFFSAQKVELKRVLKILKESFPTPFYKEQAFGLRKVGALLQSSSVPSDFFNRSFFYIEDYLKQEETQKKNLEKLVRDYKSSLLLASSELCPCGKAEIGKSRKCGYSLSRCRKIIELCSLQNLSLFQVFINFKNRDLSYRTEIQPLDYFKERRDRAFKKLDQRGQKEANASLSYKNLFEMLSKEAASLMYLPEHYGVERMRAILSVARTIADLENSPNIKLNHVESSLCYSYTPVKDLVKSF